jgi:hypothetical protein
MKSRLLRVKLNEGQRELEGMSLKRGREDSQPVDLIDLFFPSSRGSLDVEEQGDEYER